MDIDFLRNCKLFRVIPKFLSFRIPHGSGHDLSVIRRRLLCNAITDRMRDKRKFDSAYENHCSRIKQVVSSLDWYVLFRCLNNNVSTYTRRRVSTHDKKLRNLTHNRELPFTAEQTIENLSSYELSDDEKELLKNGLKFGLPTPRLSKTDVAASFKSLSTFLTANLKEGWMKTR